MGRGRLSGPVRIHQSAHSRADWREWGRAQLSALISGLGEALAHQGRQRVCSWSKGGELVGNLNILHFAKNVAAQDSYLNTQSHRHRAEMTENGEINHLSTRYFHYRGNVRVYASL